MDRPRSSAHLQPKSKTTSTLPSTSTTTPHATANKSINSSNAAAQLPTSSPETPPTRRGGWSDFSPIKLSPLKLAPSSPYSPSSRDHSPLRDSPDLFEAHTQLDQSPSSSPATPVVYQGSTPPLTPPIDRSPGSDTLTRDTLQREVTQLDLVELKNKKSDRSLNDRSLNDRSLNDRSLNDRSLNDRSMTRLLRMETRLDVDDMSHSAPVTDVKRKPALMSADTTADLLTRTTTVLDATKNSTNRSTLSTSTELLSRATTLLDIPLPNTATHHAVKWQLIGQGALNGHVIELQEGSAVQVGRGSGCVGAGELSAHKVISAVHISLVVREQHCWLTDLSSNGTWLNGLRLGT